MTNKEIDMIINKLDVEISNLQNLKDSLLIEKKKNDEKRQDTFQKFLNTPNVYSRKSKIFLGSKNIIFTNGISIYIVNPGYFKTDDYSFVAYNKNRVFDLVSFDEINKYIVKVQDLYGNQDEFCKLYESYDVSAEWVDFTGFREVHFREEQIHYCDIILNNPIYKISANNPVLKVESEIGKAYILGHKRCQE